MDLFSGEIFFATENSNCFEGERKDIVIDLRPQPKTFSEVNEFEIDEEAGEFFLISRGCGHGFLALEQENVVLYEIDGKNIIRKLIEGFYGIV